MSRACSCSTLPAASLTCRSVCCSLGSAKAFDSASVVQPKLPTAAQSPALQTRTRSGLRSVPAPPAAHHFHAQPLDRRILAGPVRAAFTCVMPACMPQQQHSICRLQHRASLRQLSIEHAPGACHTSHWHHCCGMCCRHGSRSHLSRC